MYYQAFLSESDQKRQSQNSNLILKGGLDSHKVFFKMTKIKGTTTLAKLLVEMGMDEQGGLPSIWDGSPVTHYHYYRKVVDAIASHNHQRVAIREHVRQEDLDRPIRILLTAGGAAAGGTDLESTQDFGLRQAEFCYDDGIRRTENKE